MTWRSANEMITGHLGQYVYLNRPHTSRFEASSFEFVFAGVADSSFIVVLANSSPA